MATNNDLSGTRFTFPVPPHSQFVHINGTNYFASPTPIRIQEIPSLTIRFPPPRDDSDDEYCAPYAPSPLDEYRGAGSLNLRRIRTLGGDGNAPLRSRSPTAIGAPYDPTFAADRARSILREATDALERILGVGNPVAREVQRLMRTL